MHGPWRIATPAACGYRELHGQTPPPARVGQGVHLTQRGFGDPHTDGTPRPAVHMPYGGVPAMAGVTLPVEGGLIVDRGG